MKRVVLDTNVLVSSILLRERLSKFLDLWKKGGISPILSKETFDAFSKVLHYPKFSLSEDDIKTIIEHEVLPFFEVTEIEEKITGVCRDAEDDMFPSAAVNAKASCIVTGDKDLLELGKFKSIKTLSPQAYLALLKKWIQRYALFVMMQDLTPFSSFSFDKMIPFSPVSELGKPFIADPEVMGDFMGYRDLDLFFKLMDVPADLQEGDLEKDDGVGIERRPGDGLFRERHAGIQAEQRLVRGKPHFCEQLG
jgi:hypothetical protein